MTKETKQLVKANRLLGELRDLFAAVEEQQVRAHRHELTGAVPVSLHSFMGGLRHQVNEYFYQANGWGGAPEGGE